VDDDNSIGSAPGDGGIACGSEAVEADAANRSGDYVAIPRDRRRTLIDMPDLEPDYPGSHDRLHSQATDNAAYNESR